MPRLSILSLTMAALLPGAGGTPASGADVRLVVMFGAHWCAPCMAEYRDLPGLAAAAAPDRLALAWTDRTIALPPGTPANVRLLDVDDARRLALEWAGEGYGLPFSAMLGADGRPCAIRRAPLRAADLAAMRAQCGGA